MQDISALKPQLVRLKLSGMLDTLDDRLAQAVRERWSHSRFLGQLFQDEVERRDGKKLVRSISRSGLDPGRTLEVFDFPFNPKIPETGIRELATCSFLERRENVFLLGPSGVGKSHLAQAIGNAACRKGHSVVFGRTDALLRQVRSGVGDGTRDKRLLALARIDLLILDDFGLVPLESALQTDLYELVCERYERASTIITSNRDFAEWQTVFSNPLMASAAMDRLVHRACKIVIEGKSYRLESFIKRSKRGLTAKDQ